MIEPGPHFSVADVHAGWRAALKQLGATVVNLNFSDRLNFYACAGVERNGEWVHAFSNEDAITMAAKGIESVAFEVWPDIVIITSGFFVPQFTVELLRARGMKVVLLCTESPYEDDAQLTRAAYVDWVLLNDPTNIDAFREVNQNTHYVPHAYDPAIHRPRPADPELASDFCFVGTGYPSRIDFLEQVDWSGLNVALAGNWQRLTDESPLKPFVVHASDECIDNDHAHDFYAATKASANLYRVESERPELAHGWAMGPREVELAAAETFFLRESRGESDAVLHMLPTFDGPADFEEKLRWWLSHDDERDKAVAAAAEAVSDRTFEANARRLMSLLSD